MTGEKGGTPGPAPLAKPVRRHHDVGRIPGTSSSARLEENVSGQRDDPEMLELTNR